MSEEPQVPEGEGPYEVLPSPDPQDEQVPEPPPRRGHVRIVYLGPVAPHWEVESNFGDRVLIEELRQRILARLVLVPPHDPQFRRNRERVSRDAERENVTLEWALGPSEVSEAPLIRDSAGDASDTAGS